MENDIERYFGLSKDPNIKKEFPVESTSQMLLLLTGYVVFVKVLGPKLMKNRKGFELKWALIIYNSLQVFLNAYGVYSVFPFFLNHYTWTGRCGAVDHKQPGISEKYIQQSHIYCLLKAIDLLDTVFFVLRKRYSQVTFLHFYHHIFIFSISCILYTYNSNSHVDLTGMINSFVHVIMYSYYLISALWTGPKASLWWKKYITILQLVQFVFLLVWILYPLLNGETCGYSPYVMLFFLLQDMLMIVLFSHFYLKTYVLKSKK